MRITPAHAVLGAALVLGAAGCGGSEPAGTSSGKGGAITVEATDTECKVSRTQAPAVGPSPLKATLRAGASAS
jgi:iron uptake system component EfeO